VVGSSLKEVFTVYPLKAGLEETAFIVFYLFSFSLAWDLYNLFQSLCNVFFWNCTYLTLQYFITEK